MRAKRGEPVAIVNPGTDERIEGSADHVRERFWQAVDGIRERNRDKDPDEELTIVTDEIGEIRQEEYDRARTEGGR